MTNQGFSELWDEYVRANTLTILSKDQYEDARKAANEAHQISCKKFEEFQKQAKGLEVLCKKLDAIKVNTDFEALRCAILQIVEEKCDNSESDLFYFYDQVVYGINSADSDHLFDLALSLDINIMDYLNKEDE